MRILEAVGAELTGEGRVAALQPGELAPVLWALGRRGLTHARGDPFLSPLFIQMMIRVAGLL